MAVPFTSNPLDGGDPLTRNIRDELALQNRGTRRRQYKKNVAAVNYEDLARRQRAQIDQLRYYEATGDQDRAARITRKLEKRGVDLTQFEGEGSGETWIDRLAQSGQGDLAARRANQLTKVQNTAEAEKIAGVAEVETGDEISRSFQQVLNQIAAMGGDPSSPAAQAAAANAVRARFESLDRAKLGIQQNLSKLKIDINDKGRDFDVGLLSSIGNTIEMLRAQEQADRMANYQLAAAGVGALGSLGLGLGSLFAGGAAVAPAVANRNQNVSGFDPNKVYL